MEFASSICFVHLAEVFLNKVFFYCCSLLQVEHRTTERLTEQIQKRVGSETNSLDNMSVGSSKSDKTERKVNLADQPLNLSKPMVSI